MAPSCETTSHAVRVQCGAATGGRRGAAVAVVASASIARIRRRRHAENSGDAGTVGAPHAGRRGGTAACRRTPAAHLPGAPAGACYICPCARRQPAQGRSMTAALYCNRTACGGGTRRQWRRAAGLFHPCRRIALLSAADTARQGSASMQPVPARHGGTTPDAAVTLPRPPLHPEGRHRARPRSRPSTGRRHPPRAAWP